MTNKKDAFQSGNEPLTDKEMKAYDKKHKPKGVPCSNRKEFDAVMGHENEAAHTWNVMSTGTHQALIVDETGKNIAVAYDKADAPILAAAPKMLTILAELIQRVSELKTNPNGLEDIQACTDDARCIIAEAEKGS